MKIVLEQVGKKFQRHLIFKGIDQTFSTPQRHALLGPNGSGKSTLLRIVAGMQAPSMGKVRFETEGGTTINNNEIFKHISFCAPGQELVEELTLREFLDFHFSFKKPIQSFDTESIIKISGLSRSADRPIYDYSSGMKQRVKLLQAIFSDTPVLMLDEPCSNLDEHGVNQYREWMDKYSGEKLVIVASNDVREYYFCDERLVMEDYQK